METNTNKALASKAQKQLIYGLCRYNKEAKSTAVSSISKGRTESTSKLYQWEADLLIKSLKGKTNTKPTPKHLTFDLSNSKHRYILSLCRQLDWLTPNERHPSGYIANMQKLHQWLMSKRSPIKKPLCDIPHKDLSKVIHALEQILVK